MRLPPSNLTRLRLNLIRELSIGCVPDRCQEKCRCQRASVASISEKVNATWPVETLGLTSVSVRKGRAEEAAREQGGRGVYDLVVARALAPLPVALELCLPFARPGGLVVLPRGSDLAGQLADGEAAAGLLAARLRPPIPLDDPALPSGRSLVVADKLGPTPERYPRRPGMAAKRPLTR